MAIRISIFAFIMMSFLSVSAIAGPADQAYFEQFLYHVDVDNSDPDFPTETHRYLMFSDVDKFIPMPDGRYMSPHLDLFMYADGTYDLYYRENYFTSPQIGNFMPGPCQKSSGKWAVPDTQLIVEDWGVGDRAMMNNQYAVMMEFKKDLNTPVLKGEKLLMGLGYSNVGPKQMFCW